MERGSSGSEWRDTSDVKTPRELYTDNSGVLEQHVLWGLKLLRRRIEEVPHETNERLLNLNLTPVPR